MNIGTCRSAVCLAVLIAAASARADQPACLAGDAAAGDLAAIATVEAAADAACPCADYDSSEGKEAADYRRCVSAEIRDAVRTGALRAKCKGRLAKAYKASTCGRSDDAATCIETDADGDVRCKVRATELCVGVPGRFERVPCLDAVRCIDAADDSGDWLVSSADSGSCRPPATSTTSTTAEPTTTTLEPTTTTLPEETTTTTLADEPTTTTTLVDEPTTTLPEETTTTTVVEETTTTTLEEETTTTTTSTTSTTMPCGLEMPTPVLRFFNSEHLPGYEEPAPPVVPDPRANDCASPSLLGGGCLASALDGTVTNYFDASDSFVPNACPGTTLSFHWALYKPPGLAGSPYASAGISGYLSPTLRILANSLPEVVGGADPSWRVSLTVRANQGSAPVRVVWFRFDYGSSSLTLLESELCQSEPENCHPDDANGLPPTEPTEPPN